MRKLSQSEQKKRAAKACKKMQSARKALEAYENKAAYHQFMERFAICETGYKSLLSDHLDDRGKSRSEENLKIEFDQLKTVIKRLNLQIEDKVLKTLFDGTRAIGKRNARGIRNSLSHKPNKQALDELTKKLPEFNKAMDAFEEAIEKAAEERR